MPVKRGVQVRRPSYEYTYTLAWSTSRKYLDSGQCEVSVRSVSGHYEVSVRSVCGHYEVSVRSLSGHYEVSMRSVSDQYEVSE